MRAPRVSRRPNRAARPHAYRSRQRSVARAVQAGSHRAGRVSEYANTVVQQRAARSGSHAARGSRTPRFRRRPRPHQRKGNRGDGATRGSHGNSRRRTAIFAGRISIVSCTGAGSAWPQRLRQRQPHRAEGRPYYRDRRAHRRVFDNAQVRRLQCEREARASQRGARPDRHRIPRHARRNRLGAEFHRGARRTRGQDEAAQIVGRRRRRAPNGKRSCRVWSSTMRSRSSRNSSRT